MPKGAASAADYRSVDAYGLMDGWTCEQASLLEFFAQKVFPPRDVGVEMAPQKRIG
jgi:hypothetical protein